MSFDKREGGTEGKLGAEAVSQVVSAIRETLANFQSLGTEAEQIAAAKKLREQLMKIDGVAAVAEAKGVNRRGVDWEIGGLLDYLEQGVRDEYFNALDGALSEAVEKLT